MYLAWACCACIGAHPAALLPQQAVAQDWPTPAGSYSRDRVATGQWPGNNLAPVWTILSTGLPSSVQWGDIDGDPAVEVLAVAGGRVLAWSSDGTREWASLPLDIVSVAPPVDLNGDGRPEIIGFRSITGVVILSGLNGAEVWRSPTDLSIVRKVLVADLDGDGLPNDILIPEADCGAQSRNIGRAIAYHVSPEGDFSESFRLAESTRDYHCSAGMAVADVDGDGAVEVVVVGSERLYLYSGQTGALAATPLVIGWVPFGRAEVFPVQADGDAAQELLLLSNNSAAPAINSRRALLIDQDDQGAQGALTLRWQVGAADVSLDQHSWPSSPLGDINGDGTSELVHAFWDHVTARWETRITDLQTGAERARLPGKAVGMWQEAESRAWRLFLGDVAQDAIRVIEPSGVDTWSEVGTLRGDELIEAISGFDPSSGRLVTHPIRTDDAFWVLDNRDAAGEFLPLPTYRVLTLDGQLLGEVGAQRGELWSFGQDVASQGVGQRVSEVGQLLWVDGVLQPQPRPDDGFRVPTAALEAVITGWSPAQGALVAGRGQRIFDLSRVNLAQPAPVELLSHTLLGWLDTRALDGHLTWVGVDTQRRMQIPDLLAWRDDGMVRWARDGLISTQDASVNFVAPALGHDIDGDGVPEVLLQRSNEIRGVFMLEPLSGISGQALWPAPFEAGPSTTGAGQPLVVRDAQGAARRVAFAHNVMTLHDPQTGVTQATSVEPVIFSVLGGALTSGEDEVTIAGALLHGRWRAIADNGSRLWAQNALLNGFLRYTGNGAALVQGVSGRFVVESRSARVSFDHNLVVLDALTGAVRHQLNLEDGEVKVAMAGQAVTNSLRAGVGISAPDGALYLVGDASGYLYLIDVEVPAGAAPSELLRGVWSLGESIGDVSVVNMDSDDALEVLVPLADGRTLMLDSPTLPAVVSVSDVICASSHGLVDIDEVAAPNEFCAAWSPPSQAPDGYVVTLEHEGSSSVVAGPVRVTQPFVMFERLRLIPNQRYRVAVQGYEGEGVTARSSPITRSDGAEVILPLEPPTITLSVSTDAFYADIEYTLIQATLKDVSPLAAYKLWITDPLDKVVFQQSGILNTDIYELVTEWSGLNEAGAVLPPDVYDIYVEATDATALSMTAHATVTLKEQFAVLDDPRDDADLTEDMGDDTGILDISDTMTAEDVVPLDTSDTGVDTSASDISSEDISTEDVSSIDATAADVSMTDAPTADVSAVDVPAADTPALTHEETITACNCTTTRRAPASPPIAAFACALLLLLVSARRRTNA
jgi:hypothetical protein